MRRSLLKRSRNLPPIEDRREGFEFEGRWITPEQYHENCKRVMDWLDTLPRELRDLANEHGL